MRWAAAAYAALGIALIAGIHPALDEVVAPAGVSNFHGRMRRYHLTHDDTPGARVEFSSEHDGIRLRGNGLHAWGASLSIARPTLAAEFTCPTEVPHVHPASVETPEFALAFEAKRGPRDAGLSVSAAVADESVIPSGGVCKRCWDYFVAPFTPQLTFQEFHIPLRALRQAGFGVPQKKAVDAAHIEQAAVRFGHGGPFDLLLRDFRLVRLPESGIAAP
ncbi:MAG TPA: hypothetical protein VG937_06675 [Polyangiaceae bacterium]|nr:hypothetical protein [Polyangiaceae bacterium]